MMPMRSEQHESAMRGHSGKSYMRVLIAGNSHCFALPLVSTAQHLLNLRR